MIPKSSPEKLQVFVNQFIEDPCLRSRSLNRTREPFLQMLKRTKSASGVTILIGIGKKVEIFRKKPLTLGAFKKSMRNDGEDTDRNN